MKKLLYCILISIPMLVTGCETEDASLDKTVICSQLANALVANDADNAGAEINKLLDTQGIVNGLEESLEKLIKQIDSCPTLQVTDSCYGCIKTNPPQSEIRVAVTVNSKTISRTIDLLHKDNKLSFSNIHD